MSGLRHQAIKALLAVIVGLAATLPKAANADVKPDERNILVQVKMADLPFIPIRLIFENQTTRVQRTLEWEPELFPSLTQSVLLKGTKWVVWVDGGSRIARFGDSKVYYVNVDSKSIGSLSIDEIKDIQEKNQKNTDVSKRKPTFTIIYKATTPLVDSENANQKGWSPNSTDIDISIQSAVLPPLADAKSLMLSAESSNDGVRSLEDTVPQAVVELFQVLGDIAIERAKSKGFSLLHDRIQKAVCEELPSKLRSELNNQVRKNMDLNDAQTIFSDLPLLRHTCDVVTNFRLQDLQTIRKPLLIAVLRDIGELGIDISFEPMAELFVTNFASASSDKVATEKLKQALAAIKAVLNKALIENSALTNRDAQLLLIRLSQVSWTELLTPGKKRLGCGLDLAFAVAARCQNQHGCTPAEVASQLAHPGDYFSLDGCKPSDVPDLTADWPDLERFVERLLQVLSPAKGVTPKAQMSSVISISLDVIERFVESAKSEPGASTTKYEFALTVLKQTRSFALAALAGDVPEIIISVGGLTQRMLIQLPGQTAAQRASLSKSLQLISAITAYASTYRGDGKEDAKQLAESRKKAIQNLIDAATNRSERQGNWIVSLGANVGASLVGGQYLVTRSSFEPAWTQLALPIGVAVQRLPKGKLCGAVVKGRCCPSRYFGWHFQLSPIDLGQFISYDGNLQVTSTRWANFLTASAQLGVLLGPPTSPFMLGADVRWSPTLFTQEQSIGAAIDAAAPTERGGAFRVGLFFGYYVPFFDFN